MATLHVLRVFTATDGTHGNPLGVFLNGAEVAPEHRQRIARELGFSETVFVDDPRRGEIRIFTPASELGFAGHPTVGTAWLLACEGRPPPALHPPAGEVAVRFEAEMTWIAGRAEWLFPLEFRQLDSPAAVDRFDPALAGGTDTYCWAWEEEVAGRVRSRAFFFELGIAEDEATGAAALGLCARLSRSLEIRQGRGSILHARPLADGLIEVGGRCGGAEVREFDPLGGAL